MVLKFAGLKYRHWALTASISAVTGTSPARLSIHTGWPEKPLRVGQAPAGAEEGGSSMAGFICKLLTLTKRKKDVREQQLEETLR